jgi:hypothetical protein
MLLVEIDQRLEIDGYNNFLGDRSNNISRARRSPDSRSKSCSFEQLHLPVHTGIEVVVDELSDVILEVDDGGGQIPLKQHNRARLGVRRYFPRTQAVAATAVCTFIVLASVLGHGDPRPNIGALQDEEQWPLCCVVVNIVGVIN